MWGVYDVVAPPLWPEEEEQLTTAILGLGALCALLGARALLKAGVGLKRLVPLAVCAVIIAVTAALPPPEGGSFTADLTLRLAPALATVAYASVAITWQPSRRVAIALAVTVVAATLDVLIRPVGTEWMIAASLNEGWGPLGAEATAALAFDLSPMLTRTLDGVPLLIVPCLALAASTDAASTAA